jgi:hypothetical protein
MRIVPFPCPGETDPDGTWTDELEAALNGERAGPVAESWRELREDVRALAPPIAPEFERELRERIAERGAAGRSTEPAPPELGEQSTTAPTARPGTPTDPTHADPSPPRSHRRPGRSRLPGRLGAVAMAATTGAVVVALVIAGPWRGATPHTGPATIAPRALSSSGAASPVIRKNQAELAGPGRPVAAAPAIAASTNGSGAASSPGRAQQLAASISLAATPSHVQETADLVSRLAVRVGGFVQGSHVQVQQGGASEANLTLRLPSAKLSAALASIGQLAPVRAESQSLQDITDAFAAARQRLLDATAERQALLRALAGATSQGQIDSLRERLSQSRNAIGEARAGLQAVSQRASTAEVEVTVVGDTRGASEGLTLHRGLHDAGRVLVVAAAVLLIAAAILLPLALLLIALVTGRRAWRRYQRERALDAP